MVPGRSPIQDPRHDPRFMKALRALEEAVQCQRLGRNEEADRLFAKLLKKHPDYFDALNLYGRFNYEQGRLQKALELITKAVRLNPRSINALNNLGIVLCHLNRPREAVEAFDRALALDAGNIQALNNRGNAFADLKRPDDALSSFESALKIQPDFCNAYINRGRVLLQLGRYEDALANYDRALAFAPFDADVHNNRGGVLTKLNRITEALASYDQAIALKPGFALAHCNRGSALCAINRYDDALAAFDQAAALQPQLADAWYGRGVVFTKVKRFGEAFKAYDRAIKLNPELADVEGARLHAKMQICDWSDFDAECAHLISSTKRGILAGPPFSLLAIPSSPDDQLRYTTLFGRANYPRSASPVWQGERYDHQRIRLAYLSGDYSNHPVSFLMAGVFERHDRQRFETIAISFGPDSADEMRVRIKNGVDRFVDVKDHSDVDIAKLLKSLEIDIAVDLMGHTAAARTGILANRPSPVQVNYLGYPAAMGCDFVDYIIADHFVIPATHRQYYSEKIAFLPDCFQANDRERKISDRTFSRAEVGLPENALVFCAFSNSYKITPACFDAWMRLLRQIDGSVLWLVGDSITLQDNLRSEAAHRGIDAARLIFAPRIDYADYLARYRLADLFLDTLPFNAGTTASDALWAGLPMVTCPGQTFASRMAGSLLGSIGMPEMVADSIADYEALAAKLARNPDLLTVAKSKLARQRLSHPLFNTERFTRHIEAAYAAMHGRYQAGLPPGDIDVPR